MREFKKWDYKFTAAKTLEELLEMGSEGWELVVVNEIQWIFKREIMLEEIYDYQMEGKGKFNTKLPDSFVGVMIASLKKKGVVILGIIDEGADTKVVTSSGVYLMTGSWCVNDLLNKIF